jgi:ABC-type uncharacterized transport system ATPase subunit
MEYLLSARDICKWFPGVKANECVDLDVKEGEIHALLGENGAGKTTLMNCIYGMYQPDRGTIYWRGKEVTIKSSKDAIELGIGMVHQHFMLVHNFTVLESIILGMDDVSQGPFIDSKKIAKDLRVLIDQYGLEVDLDAEIWQLPVGVQQRVEIIKALYRNADLLILDEPTAVLTPQETEEFFVVLKKLREDKKSVIIITHKLDEVMEIADRVTVLRNGEVVSTLDIGDASVQILASAMVGHDIDFSFTKKACAIGDVALEVEHVYCDNDRGLEALHDIHFEIRKGEILGVAGVSGNGQTELAEAICGLRQIKSGTMKILGEDVTNLPPEKLYEHKLSHIPEDRQAVGLIMDFNIAENSIMGLFNKEPFCRNIRMNYNRVDEHANMLVKKYDVRTPGIQTISRLLSGGNQQKLILGREIEKKPEVLIAVQPTRGLDIAATDFVQNELIEQRDNGMAILYISTELEEIFKMSDKVLILFAGRQYGPYDIASLDLETVGLMMAGAYHEDKAAADVTKGEVSHA